MDTLFYVNSVMLGVGLAMDAFCVSTANGLNDPHMSRQRVLMIAGTFAFFQFLMPMIGWLAVHTVVTYFTAFQKFIPWIALVLLVYIGGKMLIEGAKGSVEEAEQKKLKGSDLLLQGIATSIDALSVGFTIASYSGTAAFVCSLIIAAVTLGICIAGVCIGQRFGTILAGKASILGGVILICIGVEIFAHGVG